MKDKNNFNKKKNTKSFVILFITFALLIAAIVVPSILKHNYMQENKVNYVDFLEAVDKGEIKEITINKSKNIIYYKDNRTTKNTTYPDNDDFINDIMLKGIDVNVKTPLNIDLFSIFQCIFIVLMIAILCKQLADPDIEYDTVQKSDVTFNDVAGLSEIKKDLTSTIDMFLDEKYKKAGVKVPKGILLEGPPGNGKTLLAKACAGEAKINFMAINACDIESKFVSVSAVKIKRMFKTAQENAPCIIFIDEIDAIGSKRSNNSDSVSKEFNSTLTALLNQMDGFSDNTGVLVLAATNRASSLDDALLRPGRFDKKLIISEPDRTTRKKLFELYLKDKQIDDTITYEKLGNKTQGCSCAEIATIVNEAVVNSVKDNRSTLNISDFDKAILESAIKGHICEEYEQTPREKEIVAYHEAGHAIISHFYSNTGVTFVTTQPTTSGAGGFTITKSSQEELTPISDIKNEIVMLYGGRAGEIVLANGVDTKVSTGASSDISRATELAIRYILARDAIDYDKLGEYGNKKLAEEVERTLKSSSTIALDVLCQHRDDLEKIAKTLIDKEFLSEEDFLEVLSS